MEKPKSRIYTHKIDYGDMKLFYKTVIIIIIFVIVFAGGAVFLAWKFNRPVSLIDGTEKPFVIVEGATISSISEALEESHLIRSALLMKVIARIEGDSNFIQKGNYLIGSHLTTFEIYRMFVLGQQVQVKVTIPEGWTITKIAELIENKEITSAKAFKEAASDTEMLAFYGIDGESAEGFLFPDTYQFPTAYPADYVVKAFIDNFFVKLSAIYPEYKKLSQKMIYEKVILASIVEREYRVEAEAKTIASVFKNRLDIRMHLGSCATVEYIITEIQSKPHPDFLTFSDLEIESEYNTYKNYGLPPGPISNPGGVSLGAAFDPAETDYLYFVLQDRNAGNHFFSDNLNEHEAAATLYLKSR
jgi:UPF0755 protein